MRTDSALADPRVNALAEPQTAQLTVIGTALRLRATAMILAATLKSS
jgi:hypothetical protein